MLATAAAVAVVRAWGWDVAPGGRGGKGVDEEFI